MLTNIAISQIYVLDQDEALDFYVGTLGLEVHTDVDLGFMRWLTVNVPGDRDREILLETPGSPMTDAATTEQVRDLVTKGATGGTLVLPHRRLPADVRDAQGEGRRDHPGTDDAGLRNRLRPARPVRQPHPCLTAGRDRLSVPR